jgi:phosphoribosylformylglycinamidine cyclo-ligase
MGIGLCLAVSAEDADRTIAAVEAAGEKAYVIGKIASFENAGKDALAGGNTSEESRKGVVLC